MNGLAGPLHGLANQEVIKWIFEMQKELDTDAPTKEQIAEYVKKTLSEGKVVAKEMSQAGRQDRDQQIPVRENRLVRLQREPEIASPLRSPTKPVTLPSKKRPMPRISH